MIKVKATINGKIKRQTVRRVSIRRRESALHPGEIYFSITAGTSAVYNFEPTRDFESLISRKLESLEITFLGETHVITYAYLEKLFIKAHGMNTSRIVWSDTSK